MTTYVVHGGNTSQKNPKNDHFFSLFTQLVPKNEVTIVLCYFARARSVWEDLINRDKTKILNATQKNVDTLIAEHPGDLLVKIKQADVLYVAGGEATLIEPLYKELSDLPKKLDGKVYAGSSMGAFMASQQYILSINSQETKSVHKGLGLLPIQVLCHWDVETQKVKKLKLLKRNSDSPILVLNECESIVMYQ